MTSTQAKRDVRVIVMGAGMAGILAAIKLKEAGIDNVTIYEKADRIGGTWRENTYPGLTCDVPSHSYTYSFEPNPEWSCFMPPGGEIQKYFESVVEKYNIGPLIRFNEEITHCEYANGGWDIETGAGRKDRADIVIAATGVLHVPRYPDINGIDDFEGDIFHTARWDHSVPLDGKRVAVIGTGSTGVQIISALSTRAEKLASFQRSAQWIMPQENYAFTEEQKEAFRNDPELLDKMQNDPELDATIDWFSEAISNPSSDEMKMLEDIALANLEDNVSDPVLKEKLRPNYRAACKRLIYSPDFYQAVQRPNVDIITDDIECIEAKGIRTKDGVLHEFDVIALATGFQADRFMRPMGIVGRNGATLEHAWEHGPTAYMAISIPEFPNMFLLNGPNGPVGNFSLIEIAEYQWHYISQLIEKITGGECTEVSASQAGLEAFDKARIAAAKKTIFGSGCQSWYLDQNGVPATWPWTRQRFREEMSEPKLECYDIR